MSKSYKFKKFQETSESNPIIPHKHCPVCGKQFYELNQEYCSDTCKNLFTDEEKGKKKKMYRNIGIAVAAMIVLVVFIIIFS